MEIKDFINHFEDVFEDTEISVLKPETNFRELDEWSSLTALSTMAMINDEYDLAITADEMRSTTTFQQLFDLVSSKL
jgi:acyl carrier protein